MGKSQRSRGACPDSQLGQFRIAVAQSGNRRKGPAGQPLVRSVSLARGRLPDVATDSDRFDGNGKESRGGTRVHFTRGLAVVVRQQSDPGSDRRGGQAQGAAQGRELEDPHRRVSHRGPSRAQVLRADAPGPACRVASTPRSTQPTDRRAPRCLTDRRGDDAISRQLEKFDSLSVEDRFGSQFGPEESRDGCRETQPIGYPKVSMARRRRTRHDVC